MYVKALLILALLEAESRHGHELTRLIDARSRGAVTGPDVGSSAPDRRAG